MYESCNELTSLVEVYQRWLNDQTRLAVRYGFSTRKAHGWHTLTTSVITLADGQQVSIVVRACLLPVSPVVAQAGNECVFSVVVDMNSLRTYPQLPGILLSECVRLRLAGLFYCLERSFSRLTEPGLRESLTLLCWYGLINSRQDCNWHDIRFCTELWMNMCFLPALVSGLKFLHICRMVIQWFCSVIMPCLAD